MYYVCVIVKWLLTKFVLSSFFRVLLFSLLINQHLTTAGTRYASESLHQGQGLSNGGEPSLKPSEDQDVPATLESAEEVGGNDTEHCSRKENNPTSKDYEFKVPSIPSRFTNAISSKPVHSSQPSSSFQSSPNVSAISAKQSADAFPKATENLKAKAVMSTSANGNDRSA